MPSLVIVSQFAPFTPKMHTIFSTVSVTTDPKASVTTCPNVISLTKLL